MLSLNWHKLHSCASFSMASSGATQQETSLQLSAANSGQPSVPNKHALVWFGSQPCLARYLEGLSTAGMLQPWGAAQLLDQTSNIGDVLRFGSESVARGKLDVLTCNIQTSYYSGPIIDT